MNSSIKILLVCLIMITVYACTKDSGPYVVYEELINKPPTTNGGTNEPTIPNPTIYAYTISFSTHVKPMLQQNCVQACHSPQHPKLDLRPQVSYAQLLTDGFSAPYVNSTNPEQSSLYLHLAGVYTLMPQGGPKLSQGKIDTVYTWIAQGALNN